MKGVSRIFHLKALNEEDLMLWLRALNLAIAESRGYSSNLGLDGMKFKVKSWRYDWLDEKQLKGRAQIGDILLFRSNNFKSKITRGFTKSQFDHIAMILKLD